MPPVEEHQSGRGRDGEEKEGIGLVETHIKGRWRHRLDRPIDRAQVRAGDSSLDLLVCLKGRDTV